jgi:hypothetical protein
LKRPADLIPKEKQEEYDGNDANDDENKDKEEEEERKETFRRIFRRQTTST